MPEDRRWHPGLFLRSSQPVAARHQREHQRTASIFQKALISACIAPTRLRPWRPRSTRVLERRLLGKRRPKRLTNHLYRPCQATSGTVSGRGVIVISDVTSKDPALGSIIYRKETYVPVATCRS